MLINKANEAGTLAVDMEVLKSKVKQLQSP